MREPLEHFMQRKVELHHEIELCWTCWKAFTQTEGYITGRTRLPLVKGCANYSNQVIVLSASDESCFILWEKWH